MSADEKMHVTCANCGTIYRLDPIQLGAAGRMVRCTQCSNTWRQMPPEDFVMPFEEEPPAAAAEPPEWMLDDEKPEDDFAFRPSTKGQYFLEEDMQAVPESVLPAPEPEAVMPPPAETLPDMPVIDPRPLGLGALQFGALTFVLLCSVTLSALMLARQPLAENFPPVVALYEALGVPVKAPGEGLMISEMVAENRVDAAGVRTLAIEAKVSNISGGALRSPALRVAVKGARGATLKEWSLRPDGGATIATGASMPLEMKFRDAPEGAKTAEIRVTGHQGNKQ